MKKIITISLLFIAIISFSQYEYPTFVCEQNRAATSDSIIVAGGVIRAYPTNVVGSVINWKFIVDAGHDKIYFDSIVAQPSGALRVYYPTVSKIISFMIVGDEITSKALTAGASVDMAHADIYVGQYVTNGGELKGTNTSSWNVTGCSNWNIVRDTTGLTKLNIGTPNSLAITANDYAKLQIVYTGQNVRFIKRVYSGLGNYYVGFYLTDYLGNIIKGNSSISDRVVVTSNPTIQNINCQKVSGDSSQLKLFTTTANFWIMAQFNK
jgi:hypothetical protein